MWMPPHTTMPPLSISFNAFGTRFPAGEKIIAASSFSGACCNEPPAQAAPSCNANCCAAVSPSRVNANQSQTDKAVLQEQKTKKHITGSLINIKRHNDWHHGSGIPRLVLLPDNLKSNLCYKQTTNNI